MSSGTIYGSYYGGSSNNAYNMRLAMSYSMEPKTWDNGKTWYCRVTVDLHFLSSSIQIDGVAKNGTITINGNTSSFQATVPNTYNNSIVTGNKIFTKVYDVPYNSNGTGSTSIGGSYGIKVTYSGVWIDTMYVSGNLTFPTVNVIGDPGLIHGLQIWGDFETGENVIHLTWDPAVNTTHYHVYVRYYNCITGAYRPTDTSTFTFLKTVTEPKIDVSFSNVGLLQYDAIRFAFKTANIISGVGEKVNPTWQGDDYWLYRKHLMVYTAGGWVRSRPAAGNGSSWVPTVARIWNGSEWILPG